MKQIDMVWRSFSFFDFELDTLERAHPRLDYGDIDVRIDGQHQD